jgi:thiamine biosynthesis protein ThiI
MEGRLADNLSAQLSARGIPGTTDVTRMRLFVRTDPKHVAAATQAAAETFGVVSASPATSVAPTIDAITDAAAAAAREHYDGGTFAISARRSALEDDISFTSRDVERAAGDAVFEAIDAFDPEVDLEDPDFTVSVEVRSEEAFVFLEKRAGPGGLPLGTQQPVVALVSGGIDSPVAAWQVMRRGAPVIPVYLDLGEYGGADHRARACAVVSELARYAPERDMRLRIVPGGDVIADIVDAVDDERMLVFRRFMYRAAEHVARDHDAVGIVTGESIGQKSSQTTPNLAVTDAATTLPIHRPLLGTNKSEITNRAREIGTFDEATIPVGCNQIAPQYPATAATLDEVRAVEPDDLFERAAAVAANVELSALS